MAKESRSADELKQLALLMIRAVPGCEGVESVLIKPVDDDRADCNRSIFVNNLGTAEGDLAHQSAIEVHEVINAKFDLNDS